MQDDLRNLREPFISHVIEIQIEGAGDLKDNVWISEDDYDKNMRVARQNVYRLIEYWLLNLSKREKCSIR